MHTPTTTHPDDVPASEIRAILKRRFGPGADLPAKAPWPWGAKSEIEEEGKAPTDAIPTGFPDLDRVLGGLRPGWIHTFASESGSGASTLALNLVRRSVDGIQVEGGLRRHPKIALYTPRTGKDIVLLRLVSAMARVDPHRVVTGDLTALDQLRLEGARSSLATLEEGDPRFHDGYGLGVENLHRLVRALRIGAKIDVLVIDGVDALENDGMGEPLLRAPNETYGAFRNLWLTRTAAK